MDTISFNLHLLGWKAFEDLVNCIFSQILGHTLQSFSRGPDGGRDGAFYGQWTDHKGITLSGSFVIQCKHTSQPARNLPCAVIKRELPKIERLRAKGLADNYFLVTNYELPARVAAEAEAALHSAGATNATVYGAEWINTNISSYPRLRRLVPRLYGLGDLTQIVTHQAYRQAREVLDSIAPDLACFVSTASYRKCVDAMNEFGFVLLLGEPGSGKTMIANLMALSAADEWGLQTLMLSSPEDFSRLWNPDDPGQFLWVDDAFGSTQYDPNRVREWNQRLSTLRVAIHKGARSVFTSRDYIFKAAQSDLKISSFELFRESRVTIRVEELTQLEREMILYNHLKRGKQNVRFRRAVKQWLPEAAGTPRFLPEIARRFADPHFTQDIHPTQSSVRRFFDEPTVLLTEVVTNFGSAETAALALIFIEGGNISIPIPETQEILRTIAMMDSTLGQVKAAMFSLDDSFIRRSLKYGRAYWSFRHPTIRDVFATIVAADPELIDIYLAGVPARRLISEVACGQSNLEGVKIVVPSERFSAVMQKLKTIEREPFSPFDPVDSFLARRCSVEFVNKYYLQNESMSTLPGKIGLPGTYNDAVKILCRLYDCRLLPEGIRLATVDRVHQLINATFSSEFMKEPIVQLLTHKEVGVLFEELKDILLSNGTDIISEYEAAWDQEEDPEDLFAVVAKSLTVITEFGDTNESQKANDILEEIKETVSNMASEWAGPPDDDYLGYYDELKIEYSMVDADLSGRSIFDDVDT